MKKTLKIIAISTILFLFNSTYALSGPTNINVSEINDTYANITWDSLDNSLGYYLYYGKNSIDNGLGYSSNIENLIETNNATINGLENNTTYYFAITSVDNNGDESDFSNEYSFTTKSLTQNFDSFQLLSASNMKDNEVELVFNKELENIDGAIREIKIVNKDNKLDIFEIEESELTSPTKLLVKLDKPMQEGVEYEVIIIELYDSKGDIITDGINAINNFVYNRKQELYDMEASLNSGSENINIETNDATVSIENNNLNIETSDSNTVINEDNSELTMMVENEDPILENAEDIKVSEMPDTGASHIFIMILSLLLVALFFGFKSRNA